MITERRVTTRSDEHAGAPDDSGDERSLPPFSVLLSALADGAPDAMDDLLEVERIALSLPVEVDVLPDAHGSVRVLGSTPTQYTATTVLPVFHRLRLHVTSERTTTPAPTPDGEE